MRFFIFILFFTKLSFAITDFSVQVQEPQPFFVGDTAQFIVEVSWQPQEETPWLVHPVSSVEIQGLSQVYLRTEQERLVDKAGSDLVRMRFTYGIVAHGPGYFKVGPLRLEARSGLKSQEFEAPSVVLRCRPRPGMHFWLVPPLLLGIGIFVFWVTRKSRQRKINRQELEREGTLLAQELRVLEQRVGVADSQEWLLALEDICVRYRDWEERMGDAQAPEDCNDKFQDDWLGLQEEFRHARYGGGRREDYHNRETLRRARTLLRGIVSPDK